MVFFFNGLTAQVSLTGQVAVGLAQPTVNQTPITAYGHFTTGTNNVYTVTTGKTLYVTNIVVYNSTATILISGGASVMVIPANTSIVLNTPVVLTSAQIFQAAVGSSCDVSIVGYEV